MIHSKRNVLVYLLLALHAALGLNEHRLIILPVCWAAKQYRGTELDEARLHCLLYITL